MGLDMYLEAERTYAGEDATNVRALISMNPHLRGGPDEGGWYVPRWDFIEGSIAEADTLLAACGLTPLVGADTTSLWVRNGENREAKVAVNVAYWRKANAVHQWFVENVQGGTDDCGRYEVHPEALAALRGACEAAVAAYEAGDRGAAAQILPPTSGFFFGSTEVDEWYVGDLRHTIAEIDHIVRAAIEVGGITFYYQSSW